MGLEKMQEQYLLAEYNRGLTIEYNKAPVFAPQCVLKPRPNQALALSQYSDMGQKKEGNRVLGDKGAY